MSAPATKAFFARAGHDQEADVVVGLQLVEGVGELAQGRVVQGVHHLGTVHRHRGDALRSLYLDVLVGHGFARGAYTGRTIVTLLTFTGSTGFERSPPAPGATGALAMTSSVSSPSVSRPKAVY